MFIPITPTERRDFMSQNNNCFIPGYTGHCPTLRFHFGRCYGTKTKEIIKDLRDKGVIQEAKLTRYRENDPGKIVLRPIKDEKDQTRDYALDSRYRAPRYMIGYTGFIPTLNFRYGKSYGRSADDCMYEFETNQRRLQDKTEETEKLLRLRSAPKLTSIRGKDEVRESLKDYEDQFKFPGRVVSEEFPPIAGYTGHIPRVKGNEESLSQRYHSVVKKGFSLLKEDRDRREALKTAQRKITKILRDADNRYILDEEPF